jgi:FtsH-binding integral membrane protein
MEYYDYRPHAIAAGLFLILIVIGCSLAIVRRKKTLSHIGHVLGWALLAVLCFIAIIGSVGPPRTQWLGLVIFSGLLILLLRFGIRSLKAMKPRQ